MTILHVELFNISQVFSEAGRVDCYLGAPRKDLNLASTKIFSFTKNSSQHVVGISSV